ncbi:hypothetical protein [Pseudoxanthomonas mexicana]
MNATYDAYKQKSGFLNGLAAWFKCIAIGVAVLTVLFIALLVAAWFFNGTPERALQILMDPSAWAYIVGIPVAAMIYFLPFFIEMRVSRSSDGLTMGLLMNILFGWFPVFWFIMLMLAIFKNR